MGSLQVLSHQIRVDLGVTAMKGYSTFPKSSGLEPNHQMAVINRTLVVVVVGSYPSV